MELNKPLSVVTNENCMDMMGRYPDKFFDLAIVDPPYGIKEPAFRRNDANIQTKKAAKTKDYHNAVFNQSAPNQAYFDELRRVSKNQIIWGGNYFGLPASRCWIVWDKKTKAAQWADAELAYTSFTSSVKIFEFAWNGMIQGNMGNKEERIHPTQKPVALYRWCLETYAKKGDKILDTHLGSGSSRIAAYFLGFDFYGCELERVHFEDQERRFAEYLAEPLFEHPKPETIQVNFFDALDNAV